MAELSLIDDILNEAIKTSPELEDLDILTFIEQKLDLGYPLSRNQKIVLKSFYNLPMDEEDIAVLEYWKIENVDRTTYDFDLLYQTLILESGRGSGKTTLGAIMCLYAFDFCLTKDKPHKWFRDRGCSIGNSTPIDILVIATGQEQTAKGIFSEISGMIEDSMYFKSLVSSGVVEVTLTEIRCKTKRIRIRAGHSNSRSQVGGSILLLVLDEAVRFENDKGENNALLILRNVGKGTQRFASYGRRLVISSAWCEGDVMETLYEGCKGSAASLGFRLTTYCLNPTMYRERPDIEDTYKEKYEWSLLEYEGIRPASRQGFFTSDLVKSSLNVLSNLVVEQDIIEENGVPYIILKILSGLEPVRYPCFAHVDYGIVNDATTLAVGYVNPETYKIIIDLLLVWQPYVDSMKGLVKPNIENIEEIILEIHKVRKIETLTFDQFNSEATIQKLNRLGINTRRDFTTAKQKEEYINFRRLMQNQKVGIASNSKWSELLTREMTQLLLKNNTKIDHPPKGSKDLVDACMAVGNLCNQWRLLNNIGPMEISGPPVFKVSLDRIEDIKKSPIHQTDARQRLRTLKDFSAY